MQATKIITTFQKLDLHTLKIIYINNKILLHSLHFSRSISEKNGQVTVIILLAWLRLKPRAIFDGDALPLYTLRNSFHKLRIHRQINEHEEIACEMTMGMPRESNALAYGGFLLEISWGSIRFLSFRGSFY